MRAGRHHGTTAARRGPSMDFAPVLHDVRDWAIGHGIEVREQSLKRNVAGTFDGVSVALNPAFTPEELTDYFSHAVGSIVRWSLSRPAVQQLFDELRAAKEARDD